MDPEQITTALGLASSAVGLTGKAATTISTIKGLFQNENSPASEEAQQLLNTLAGELTAANIMNVQISAALKELNQELQRQDDFEQEKARYELFETAKGDIVYRLRHDMTDGQPVHYVCPVCMSRDKLISFVTGGYSKSCQTNTDHIFRFETAPAIRMRGH
jgi:hypothetical protein